NLPRRTMLLGLRWLTQSPERRPRADKNRRPSLTGVGSPRPRRIVSGGIRVRLPHQPRDIPLDALAQFRPDPHVHPYEPGFLLALSLALLSDAGLFATVVGH